MDSDGAISRYDSVETPYGDRAIIDDVVARIATVSQRHIADGGSLVGVGIGIPGRLSRDAATWAMALNLGVTKPVALRAELEAQVDLPITIANDVALSTLGAAHYFSDVDRLALLSVGTGIAGGALDRSEDSTTHGRFDGEVGHITVPGVEVTCRCGQVGCLESVAGGEALEARWRAAGGTPLKDAGELWDRADRGDDRACLIRDDCVAALAWAVRLYAVVFGADAVVLGGGVSRLGDRLAEPIRQRLRDLSATSSLMASYGLADRLRFAPADAEFGLVGAARLAFDAAAANE